MEIQAINIAKTTEDSQQATPRTQVKSALLLLTNKNPHLKENLNKTKMPNNEIVAQVHREDKAKKSPKIANNSINLDSRRNLSINYTMELRTLTNRWTATQKH